MKKILASVVFALFFLLINFSPVSAQTKPIIGAIRWDGFNSGPVGVAEQTSLSPLQWHYRLPFWANVVSDNQAKIQPYNQIVLDQEIAYAKQAGINFWAFDLYNETDQMSEGLDYYLASSHVNDVNFAVISGGYLFTSNQQRIISLMTKPQYQKVLGGRPLFILAFWDGTSGDWNSWLNNWGGATAAKAKMDAFRASVKNATGANPYVVVMNFNINIAHTAQVTLGADAITRYALGASSVNQTYADCVKTAPAFWNSWAATGSNIIPTLTAGWDPRPRDPTAAYCQSATPPELANHIKDGVNWINSNSTADPSQVGLIYAWNEHSEGGWLSPTLLDGATRIDAISQVLNPVSTSLPAVTGWWKFDETSGDAIDSSGNNLTGTPKGTTIVAGKYGNARSFVSSKGDYINVPSSSLINSWPSITASAWINITSLPPAGSYYAPVEKGGAYRFIINSDGTAHFIVATTNNGWYTPGTLAVSPMKLTPGTWYHIAGTYDGSVVRIFINGVLQGTSYQQISGNITSPASSLTFSGPAHSTIIPFNGLIDNVRLYKTALTEQQMTLDEAASAPATPMGSSADINKDGVVDLNDYNLLTANFGKSGGGITGDINSDGIVDVYDYNLFFSGWTPSSPSPATLPTKIGWWKFDETSGNAVDSSGNNLTGTPTGTTIVAGKYGNARKFGAASGDYDYINMGNGSILSNWTALTVSGWINMSTLPANSNTYFLPMGKDSAYRFIVSADGAIHFVVATSNNGWYSAGTVASANTKLTTNTWYHIAGVYDGTKVKIYINGNLAGTSTPNISGALVNSTSPFTVGIKPYSAGGAAVTSLGGIVDNVHLYKTALTETQIQSDMNP